MNAVNTLCIRWLQTVVDLERIRRMPNVPLMFIKTFESCAFEWVFNIFTHNTYV